MISDGAAYGIVVTSSAAPTILGNEVHGNAMGGIVVGDAATPTVTGNGVQGDQVGIAVSDGAAATIDGREVSGPHTE